MYEKMVKDTTKQINELSAQLSQTQELLAKTQNEMRQLNSKYIGEVKSGAERAQSTNEERAELMANIEELKEENTDYKNNLSELRLENQRLKMDSQQEI